MTFAFFLYPKSRLGFIEEVYLLVVGGKIYEQRNHRWGLGGELELHNRL